MDKVWMMMLDNRMADSEQTGNSKPLILAVDLVLCLSFFGIMSWLVSSHVQSRDPRIVILWSGLTASCMTIVFWLATQMFRTVLRAQRENRSNK
jgi:hypothetical protein